MKSIHRKIIFSLIISITIAPIDAAKGTGFSHVTNVRYIPHKESVPRPIPPISPERQAMRDEKASRQCKENCCTTLKVCGLICCALVADNCFRK